MTQINGTIHMDGSRIKSMAWDGLRNYGYLEDAERLAYRWLFLLTKVFFLFNGTVVEKYDATQLSDLHKASFDYGNQGLSFKDYAKEGLGWTNASYVHGLDMLTRHAKRSLEVLAPWEVYPANQLGMFAVGAPIAYTEQHDTPVDPSLKA